MALTKLPGFIDIHVHLRDPGAIHKEDFVSGSRAAIKGGFTYIVDMPNNPTMPTITPQRLEEKIGLSQKKARCDVGFYYGTDGKNTGSFSSVWNNPHVFGLKIYCNHTTGDLLLNQESKLAKVFGAWESDAPVLVHAEGEQLGLCLSLAKRFERRLHVCHIAEIEAIGAIRRSKETGQRVTAGVTPHHLFLTVKDVEKLGSLALVKPFIGDEQTRLALWEGLLDGTIDLVESDHAPHTREEKVCGTPCFGGPGLETTIGLLMYAVVDGRLTVQQVVTLLYDHPKKIFSIPDQHDTFIELDPQKSYKAGVDGYETKCGWSPYDGWELFGKVERVVLRGTSLVEHGRIV